MQFKKAPDIKKRVKNLVRVLDFSYIEPNQIVCMRSNGSKSRARARIWSFPKIWQLALKEKPHYIIEVLSEKFDHLKYQDQTKVLIHELMHIPKNFSGALLPHQGRGKVKINRNAVEILFQKYKKEE